MINNKPATKHYEQATQAMVLKDRQRYASVQEQKKLTQSKKHALILSNNKRINPNEIKFPDGLKADEKEKLLSEIKKKWQADFGQRIRVEEANRSLKEQLNKVQARLKKLEDQVSCPNANKPMEALDSEKHTIDPLSNQRTLTKKHETTTNLMMNEENFLRKTNIIVVLTKRNKELVNQRKKLEHLVHLKTLAAEQEIQKASKLQQVLESEKSKHVRDKLKSQAQINDLQKTLNGMEQLMKENQRKYENLDRINLSLEHQIAGLKDKLDSVMIDYSDVLSKTHDTKEPNSTKEVEQHDNRVIEDQSPQDEEIKQARLEIEYQTWVSNKSTNSSPAPEQKQLPEHPISVAPITDEQEQITRLQEEARLKEVQREIQAEQELTHEQQHHLLESQQHPPSDHDQQEGPPSSPAKKSKIKALRNRIIK